MHRHNLYTYVLTYVHLLRVHMLTPSHAHTHVHTYSHMHRRTMCEYVYECLYIYRVTQSQVAMSMSLLNALKNLNKILPNLKLIML